MLRKVWVVIALISVGFVLQARPGLADQKGGGAKGPNTGQDIESVPLISEAEKAKIHQCKRANGEICERDYTRCTEEASRPRPGGYADCFQQKLDCLNGCRDDHKACKKACAQHYKSGCYKACTNQKSGCLDKCEKQGDDCTRNALAEPPQSAPSVDCEKRRQECLKVVDELCRQDRPNMQLKLK